MSNETESKLVQIKDKELKSLEDYTGGSNNNDVELKLEQLGYKIVEKRKQKYDFNSL